MMPSTQQRKIFQPITHEIGTVGGMTPGTTVIRLYKEAIKWVDQLVMTVAVEAEALQHHPPPEQIQHQQCWKVDRLTLVL